MSIFRDLMWYFKQERKSYGSGILVLIMVSLLNLLPPFIVGKVVDAIRFKTLTLPQLGGWLGVIFGTAIIVYILRYIWRIMLFGSAIRLGRQLRNQLYTHFTRLTPQFYHQSRIGDLMAHSTNDISAVQMTAGEGVLTLVDSITMGGLVVLSMSAIHWKLTLIALLPMPFMAWATSYYGSLLHKRFHDAQEAFSLLNDTVQENIAGVRVIKAFGQEEAEKEQFKKISADVVKKNMRVAKVDALFDPTISFIVGLSFLLTIGFGAIFVIEESLTIGQLTTFTLYLGHLIWPMLAFGWLFNIMEKGRASYDRIRSLLETEVQIIDREHAKSITPSGEIEYSFSLFTYPNKKEPTLQNIFWTLQQGQTLGIVGKTGSGKTTMLRLLLREFDLEEGDIFIGGESIYEFQLSSLRKSIGYVPQDHFLFSAMVADNIAFGKPDATPGEIERAAEAACIHQDILRFQHGYHTLVGERGVTLSGGQKQRISIARALLMNPHILVLDDALSAVDAQTEENILHSLRTMRQGKTTLIAAHRLSALQHAHLILVLEEGQIIERGTHEELVSKEGWYAQTYRRQQLESMVSKGGTP